MRHLTRKSLSVVALAAIFGVTSALPVLAAQQSKASALDTKYKSNGGSPQTVQKAPKLKVSGDHLWINGLALMGKRGDFKGAKAGQWIRLSGFDAPENNGTFRIASVDPAFTSVNLEAKSGTVFEAALANVVRKVEASGPPTPGDKPPVPGYEIEGDHLWMNGLALVGKPNDFRKSKAGQWIMVRGFDTPANNGTFLIESVDPTFAYVNLKADSATVYEAALANAFRTIKLSEAPTAGAAPEPAKPGGFEFSGEHLSMNGPALLGKENEFRRAKAGFWVRTSGFANAANNGVFQIVSVDPSFASVNFDDKSGTVFEAAVEGELRKVEISEVPLEKLPQVAVARPNVETAVVTSQEEPAQSRTETKAVEEPFEVSGDHLWMNGLAVMGRSNDFSKAKPGQWVKLSGFDNPVNNGTFLIESVDPSGAAINLDAKSGTVFEAASPGKTRTATSVKAASEPKQPAKEDTRPSEPTASITKDQPKVTNVAVDSDLRAFLKEIASQTGATIIADESITSDAMVSIEFQDEPLETALEKLSLMVGAFWKKKGPNFYLISKATPKSSLFREFATTKMYVPKNQSAATIAAVISSVYKEYVNVDPKMNVIGITAPGPLMQRILEDVLLADSASRQFVVEAMVAELTYEDGKDFGFSWSWKNFSLGSDLSMTYAKAGFADIVKLKSLIDNRQATLLANPRLTAFEGRDADFTVGQETYYSLITGNVNLPFQQIQLIKTGITIKFIGFVGEDGTITLNLMPEVSDAIVAVNGNPTTNVRRANTSVRVKPGETIVMAGLSQHSTDKRVTRVPILGQIPFIGELFKSSKSTKRKTDVIIMITPRLTDAGVGVSEEIKAAIPPVQKSGGK